MTCSVQDCSSPIKYKGLCSKHYKRMWRHGDPLQTAYRYKETAQVCAIAGCELPARRNNYCNVHSARISRHGTPDKLNNRGSGRVVVRKYNDRHRAKAASALGRPLPDRVVVHHHDGAPSTLVICPDQAYHMMIHARMRRQQTNRLGS